jgi:putative ABC transport system ATP-binding protein
VSRAVPVEVGPDGRPIVPSGPALLAEGLSKHYTLGAQRIRAVDDVSFQVQPGEFVALVGPSGSGKTSLLAMLAGLLRPSEGRVRIADRDIGDLGDRQLTRFRRRNIGFTFQANNLLPYLTVLENVMLMLSLNDRATPGGRDWALDLLSQLGLEERLNSLPSQLSGGQQQRVSIARALIHRPAVVLADEPTASLDTERAYQVVRTFGELIGGDRRAGIMVTHDLRMCRFVDRVILMRDGVVERVIDDPDEVRSFAEGGP